MKANRCPHTGPLLDPQPWPGEDFDLALCSACGSHVAVPTSAARQRAIDRMERVLRWRQRRKNVRQDTVDALQSHSKTMTETA